MKRRLYWILAVVLLAALAAIAFGWMTLNTAQSKAGGWVSAVILLALGVAAAVSSYVLAPRKTAGGRPFLLTPQGLAALVVAATAGLGSMSLLFPLLDPPTATVRDVESASDRTTEAISSDLERRFGPAEAERPILAGLPGLWGETGCAVVYRFRVEDGAVLVDRVRKAAGMADYAMAASIAPGGPADSLNATLERSTDAGETRGQALVFTYVGTGAGERLIWQNRTHADLGGTELVRCPGA